ncbi:MAG: hypothetical protein DWP97_08505 [Calditrichaeota bacterium]|nr:MAG: hypothetical protein DWP97_08505 [Calditrichota bacterium]
MLEIKSFISKCIYPEQVLDVWISSFIILIILFGAFFKYLPFTKRFVKSMLLSFMVCFLYLTIQFVVIPNYQKFNENEYGILITRFAGADQLEQYGIEYFNEILKNNIVNKIETLNLSEVIDVKTHSYVMNDIKKSKELKNKFNAYAIISGEITSYKDSIKVLIHIDLKPILFGCTMLYEGGEISYDVTMQTGYTRTYPLFTNNKKLNYRDFLNSIVYDLMFYVAAFLNDKDLELSEEIMVELPNIDNRIDYLGQNYKAFFYQSVAFAYYRKKDYDMSHFLFKKSFDEFSIIKDRFDEGKENSIITEEKLRGFSSVSLYYSNFLYLKQNDTLNAIIELGKATIVNPIFVNNYSQLYESYFKVSPDSIITSMNQFPSR